MQAPGRIYVRAPNWVGDLVMATASFRRLREGFPAARIVCGLRGHLRPLLDGSGFFDDYLDMPRVRGPRELWRQVGAVRSERPDLAVVLPNSFETALVPFLARVPRRLGYRQGRTWLLTEGPRAASARRWPGRRGPRRQPESMPAYYARLLDRLGLPPAPLRGGLAVTPEEEAGLREWLRRQRIEDHEPLALLNPGAAFGASKLWSVEGFAATAVDLRARGLRPVVLAGPGEEALARAIAARSGAAAAVDPVLGLGVLKAIVRRAEILVTTDTGPRHVALAFGVPVVCLMGPTDPRYTDYAPGGEVVLRKELPCAPCHRPRCPLGHHECMRAIGVPEVLEAVETVLARRRGGGRPGG